MFAVVTKQLSGKAKAFYNRDVIGSFDERLKSKDLDSEIISRYDLIVILFDHLMYLSDDGDVEVRIEKNCVI